MGIGLGIGLGSPMRSVDADWLLRDEFIGELAAGAVDGTAAEPGPGTRVATDGNSKLTIASGLLSFATGGVGAGDPGLWLDAATRAAGRVMLAEITPANTDALAGVGFDSNQAGAVNDAIRFAASGALSVVANGGTALTVGAYTATSIPVAVVMRATGACFFAKFSGDWLLFWRSAAGTGSGYPAVVATGTTAIFTSAWLRSPTALWLPAPLVSDGFGSAYGSSDGLGHAEGIAGGIGSGGSGVTFSNAGGTWSVSGGKAINTPVPGSELLTNGNMETGDPPTSWAATKCTADGVADERTGGSGSQSVALTATDIGEPYISQGALSLSPGGWYKLSGWMKQTIGSSGVKLRLRDNHVGGYFIETAKTNSSTWTFASATGVTAWTLHNTWAMFSNSASVSDVGYFDDLSFKQLALSELLSVSNLSCSDVFAGVALTRGNTVVQCGLGLNWDSASSPANGVIVYADGTTINVDKYVAGTRTNVSSTAYTYSAGARLVVAKSGSEYRVYYNNAFIVAVTISDASIINNTLHGLFSTDASNTLDDFVCYATGTGGEYAELDKWS